MQPRSKQGIDNIPPILLKRCAYALVHTIHHLFTTLINSGTMPAEWKVHKIVAVYKSRDKTSNSNAFKNRLTILILKNQ